jgi:hypothetical protein
LALASEIVLKSGQKLEGKIVERTDKYIKFDSDIGLVLTYYADEIDTVDGQKFQDLVSPTPVVAPIAQVTDKALAIIITNVKMASGIDEKLMPVQATDVFPAGITQAFCWFEWKNARVGTKIIARWHFVTDNIHILNYEFTIPKKAGSGGISLTMPEGKKLPEGIYKIDLSIGEDVLKSLTFKVGNVN